MCLSEGLRPKPPLDLTTAASAADFRAALEQALADEKTDAVVVTAIPAVGEGPSEDAELAAALSAAAATGPTKPVLVVHVELGGLAEALSAAASTGPNAPDTLPQRAASETSGTPGAPEAPDAPEGTPPPVDRTPRLIPAYPAAERAVRALSQVAKYAQWRRDAATPGKVPEYDAVDEQGAAELITELLAKEGDPRGADLAPEDARALLSRYGIDVRSTLPAPGPDEAAEAAHTLGYPVALKTTAPHLRHRPDLGGVRLDLSSEGELRRAYEDLTQRLGKPAELRPVVQAMAPRGVDTVVRAVIDPAAGAVLSFGLAGAASELLGDTAHRLIPVTDKDAQAIVRSIKTSPILFGWRGAAPWTLPRSRSCCSACRVWSTTTPRSSASPLNRSSWPSAG